MSERAPWMQIVSRILGEADAVHLQAVYDATKSSMQTAIAAGLTSDAPTLGKEMAQQYNEAQADLIIAEAREQGRLA